MTAIGLGNRRTMSIRHKLGLWGLGSWILSVVTLLPALASAFEMHEKEYGKPVEWQMDLQLSVTPVMNMLIDLHNLLMVVITVITIFVMLLLAYVCVRFSAKRNPVPSRTTHNTMIEVVWTTIPVIILVGLAIPTLKTLYYIETIEDADMTLKVVGNQWYWHYAYPDHGGFEFDSNMKAEDDLLPGELRLLEVDNRVVVPVDTTVRVEMTAADVIHNWAIPAFGIKQDVVPGKLTEVWFRANRTGVYYGQCSELCGIRHGFMPIAVEVVEQDIFDAWVTEAQANYASAQPVPDTPLRAGALQMQHIAYAE